MCYYNMYSRDKRQIRDELINYQIKIVLSVGSSGALPEASTYDKNQLIVNQFSFEGRSLT